MNNKSASIRAVLHQNPDGMDYEQLSRATGVARDKIAAFVAALITTNDVKPYIIDGQRIFKYCGDPSKVGPRVPGHVPAYVASGSSPPGAKGASVDIPAFTQDSPQRAVQAEATGANTDVRASEPRVAGPAQKSKGAACGGDLRALIVENVISAASQLAAAVREHVDMGEVAELERAVKGFELAEKIHQAARAA